MTITRSSPRQVFRWIRVVFGLALIAGLMAGCFVPQPAPASNATSAGTFESRFQAAKTPGERVTNLAGLFHLANGAYADKAWELFDSLGSKSKNALFTDVRSEADQLIIARGVYQSLYVNVSTPSEEEDTLLGAMGQAVKNVNPALAEEIGYWLEGRRALANQDQAAAINRLQLALAKNEHNPAIWMDLARAQIGLGSESAYSSGLHTLERVVQTDTQKIYLASVRQQLNASSSFGAYWRAHRTDYPPLVSLFETPMARIPAGSFQMGSEQGERDEKPVHTVTLNTFWMDVHEVTNIHYADCVTAQKCRQIGWQSSLHRTSYYYDRRYAYYPVLRISWEDAQTYCEWRGKRLPTEAEWEKAARGGLEGKQYVWGDEAPVCTPGAVNGAQFSRCPIQDTTWVGRFAPNGYGLFDMAGNAWEFVNDNYYAIYYSSSPASNPPGPADEPESYKVVRGGGLYYDLHDLRVARRSYSSAEDRSSPIGFRCAASVP